ncbi:hypothetical protein LOK49_LG01G03394 [Camellia lanceoleosa]|uniref:Uncharacterized protein n=1 Tax=Camellia lanceoleosa TaxID=1840588 RepID=A0ACC0IY17_9ERIC|nr:hypothetical protein LOK49_LG01G03394 [Camellia lanceoleosa]
MHDSTCKTVVSTYTNHCCFLSFSFSVFFPLHFPPPQTTDGHCRFGFPHPALTCPFIPFSSNFLSLISFDGEIVKRELFLK